MKKRNLIIFISSAIFLLLVGVSVYAAFVFNVTLTSNNYSGDITIEKEGYISYSLNSDISNVGLTTSEYQAILKERAGGWLVDKEVETDINTTYGNYYTRAINEATTYSSGTIYYILDDTNNYVYRDIEEFDEDETYYTMTFTKASSYSSSTDYYRLGHKYDSTVDSNTDLTNYYVLTSIDLEGFGVYTSASSYNANTKYYKLVYTPVDIQATGVIQEGENTGINCVNTYGTQRTGSLAETENHIYLNQVGFEFSISTKIDCYVRIKFRDAWVSSKLYRGSSTPKVTYTTKKQISGRSPFYVQDSNWYFDTTNNVAYLKLCMQASDSSYNYSFNINPTYFYSSDSTTFTERMIVQVSYSLELIQANRAKTVWGIDPSDLA